MPSLENMDIESAVRAKFHVDSETVTNVPCWLLGSVEENHRDYYQHHVQVYSKEILKLKLEYQQQQKKLQLYENLKETITKIGTCSVCQELKRG
jgi:hypothetical protein